MYHRLLSLFLIGGISVNSPPLYSSNEGWEWRDSLNFSYKDQKFIEVEPVHQEMASIMDTMIKPPSSSASKKSSANISSDFGERNILLARISLLTREPDEERVSYHLTKCFAHQHKYWYFKSGWQDGSEKEKYKGYGEGSASLYVGNYMTGEKGPDHFMNDDTYVYKTLKRRFEKGSFKGIQCKRFNEAEQFFNEALQQKEVTEKTRKALAEIQRKIVKIS